MAVPSLTTVATPRGKVMDLRIEDLRTDPNYQRELNQALVDKIAESWDTYALDPIKVSKRANGELYIINGQHRTAAAKMLGLTTIRAEVFEGLDPQQEAAIRLKGNLRRGDTPQERFRAQVQAGDPESLAIQEICEAFGTVVNRTPESKRGINAVSALEEVYRIDEGVTLVRVFELIRDAFGGIGGQTGSQPLLKSVAFLLDRHSTDRNYDRRRMVERLGVGGIGDLHRKAQDYRTVHLGGLWLNYYRAMVAIFNERLPEGKRLQWRITGWKKSEGD